MAQRVVAWDDSTDHMVRTTKDPADIGAATSPTGEDINAGTDTINSSATSVSITYTDSFSHTSYGIIAQIINTVDSSVQYQPLVITAKSTSGFTATWNAPADSANYKLDWITVDPCVTYHAGLTSLSSGVDSVNTELFLANSLAILPIFQNTADTSPLFQPPIVSLQEAPANPTPVTQFTTSWNVNTDSTNYSHGFVANNINCASLKSFITSISNGATSVAVTFPYFAMQTTAYAICARLMNVDDADATLQYQPVTITSKSTTGFTAKWNTPTGSANYFLEWIANVTN